MVKGAWPADSLTLAAEVVVLLQVVESVLAGGAGAAADRRFAGTLSRLLFAHAHTHTNLSHIMCYHGDSHMTSGTLT